MKIDFFKSTPPLKEYLLLDAIEKDSSITQREIAALLGVPVSRVNDFINTFESEKLIKRIHKNSKSVSYLVSPKGIERRKVLNIGYIHASELVYEEAQKNIEAFLQGISIKGIKTIILYGAGEVAEILMHTISRNPHLKIQVPAIVDDDLAKQGKNIYGTYVSLPSVIASITHDGLLIASYAGRNRIKEKLTLSRYPEEKILEFF